MFCQGCGREAGPSAVRSQFLGENVASKLKGNTGTVLNRSSDKIVSSAGHNGFSCDCWTYLNQIAVKIILKWPNLNYPCHLVGRHVTFPVTTTLYIPWVEFVFPIWDLAGYNFLYFLQKSTYVLRENRKCRVLQNSVVRTGFGPEEWEWRVNWLEFHSEQLHDFYCSPNFNRVSKSRKTTLARYVERWWEKL
jgi:hypothetical protein